MALFPVPDTYSARWESGARQHEPGGLTGRWKERTETAESLNLPGLLCVTCRCYSQRLSKPPPRENVIPTLTRWTGFFPRRVSFLCHTNPLFIGPRRSCPDSRETPRRDYISQEGCPQRCSSGVFKGPLAKSRASGGRGGG